MCMALIVPGRSHLCMGRTMYGYNRVGTIMQAMDTNVSGDNRVRAQTFLSRNISGHNRVRAQACRHNRVVSQPNESYSYFGCVSNK